MFFTTKSECHTQIRNFEKTFVLSPFFPSLFEAYHEKNTDGWKGMFSFLIKVFLEVEVVFFENGSEA